MTNDAVRLLVQLARTEQDAGHPIPQSIADQLLALVEDLYEATPAARKRRCRVTSASRERPASVPMTVTSASRERDISVPQAAALGRGVGGMGVVVVEELHQNNNSAVQEQQDKTPSLDDLVLLGDPIVGVMVQRGTIPASVLAAQQGMQQRAQGVQRGNARRQRYESMVELVFGYWRATYTKPSTVVLGTDRRRVILRALDENEGNLSELFFALDGARKDDWIMGRDPRSNGRYDTPETILRDRGSIERHAGRMGSYGKGETHREADLMTAALTETQPHLMQGVA